MTHTLETNITNGPIETSLLKPTSPNSTPKRMRVRKNTLSIFKQAMVHGVHQAFRKKLVKHLVDGHNVQNWKPSPEFTNPPTPVLSCTDAMSIMFQHAVTKMRMHLDASKQPDPFGSSQEPTDNVLYEPMEMDLPDAFAPFMPVGPQYQQAHMNCAPVPNPAYEFFTPEQFSAFWEELPASMRNVMEVHSVRDLEEYWTNMSFIPTRPAQTKHADHYSVPGYVEPGSPCSSAELESSAPVDPFFQGPMAYPNRYAPCSAAAGVSWNPTNWSTGAQPCCWGLSCKYKEMYISIFCQLPYLLWYN